MKAFRQYRPNRDVSTCLELVGLASDVLLLGEKREELLREFDSRGHSVTCIVANQSEAEEARVYCSNVHVLSPEAFLLPPTVRAARFDRIVLGQGIADFQEPNRLVADAKQVIRKDGFMIVTTATEDDEVVLALDRLEFDLQTCEGGVVKATVRVAPFAVDLRETAAQENLLDLQSELASERSARRELQRAFEEMQSTADVAKGRIPEMGFNADDVEGLRASLREQIGRTEVFAVMIEAATATIAQVEAMARQTEEDWFSVYAELEERRIEVAALRASVSALTHSNQAAIADAPKVSDALACIDELESDIAKKDELLTSHRAHIGHLEQVVAERTHLLSARESQVAELEAAIAQEQAQSAGLRQVAHKELERLQERHRAEMSMAQAELEALHNASLAEKVVMQEYANELAGRLSALVESEAILRAELTNAQQLAGDESRASQAREATLHAHINELEQRLAAQTEDMLDATLSEINAMAALVDTVQSGRFWKFKRWLKRLGF